MVPKVNYIVNGDGEKLFVQMSVRDWDKLMTEHQRLVASVKFRNNLQTALNESVEIERGKTSGVTLSEFLDEL